MYCDIIAEHSKIDQCHNVIHIEILNDDELVSTDSLFTVIESEAYYEAYHHVLSCLQTFGVSVQNREDFPFERYLVR